MILVRKLPHGYVGVATASIRLRKKATDVTESHWIFPSPISREELVEGLIKLGRHGQDIWDVIAEADATGWGYMAGMPK